MGAPWDDTPGWSGSTAVVQTPVAEVYGTPGDGKVPTWSVAHGRLEWATPTGGSTQVSGQLVAFGGSTTYNGDAVGLAYDPVAQTITVTNAGMYVVRLAQSLLSTAV